eukprot:GHVP01003868.1.p1 GENE.GHVP01003868.1~~GHVP01003868.1.p1  ORF type:complete len:348 (-),score=68.40 GHVP01003868.1:613-1656(-)
MAQNTPGAFETKIAKDRTRNQKISRAKDLVERLRQTQRKAPPKETQDEKRRKRRTVVRNAYPVAKEGDDESMSTSEEEGPVEDEEMDELVKQLEECLSFHSTPFGVPMEIVINGNTLDALLDTASEENLISQRVAGNVGLELTEEVKKFRGVGRGKATVTRAVTVRFATNQNIDTIFHVMKEDMPTIIGLRTMAVLNLTIDPRKRAWKNEEMVMFSKGYEKSDRVSEKREKLDDHEFLKERLPELWKAVGDEISEERRQCLGDLLQEYKDIWLRPKTGQCKIGGEVELHITGKPVKSKLRPLTPEMKEAERKEIQAMLDAGVIRRSKSDWSASPVYVQKKDGSLRMA